MHGCVKYIITSVLIDLTTAMTKKDITNIEKLIETKKWR
jgi:hypothetical protein